MADFLQTVKERVVVYDGAMGTNIQKRNPTLDDYWGKENCSEVLVLSRPDIIRDIHADFFRVGCDIVETNTFGGSGIVLGEFDLRDRVHEINLKAAQLAKEVAQQFSTKDRAAVRRRLDGADHQAAVARSHRVRGDGCVLRRTGRRSDRRRRRRSAHRDCAGFVASQDRNHRRARSHAEIRASDCL